MVMDQSGPASFVLFDREVMQFTNKTATELREGLIRVSIVASTIYFIVFQFQVHLIKTN